MTPEEKLAKAQQVSKLLLEELQKIRRLTQELKRETEILARYNEKRRNLVAAIDRHRRG